ncbi:MAG: MG2 domain-containing protein, partial [Bacteroidales bacterium]
MKQLSFIFFLLFFLFSLQSCKQQPTQVSFNDYVEEYTTGIVSRKNSVEIMLSEPLSTEQQNPELLRKAFSITPKATGKLEVLNDKRIVFQPDPGFDAGIRYTVTLNLSEFFKTSEKDKKFTFSFETIAPDLAFRLNELDIDVNEKHDTIYEVKGSILLSDWADSTTIHNLIGFDTPVIIDWDKVECSKIFDFTLTTRSPFQVEKQIEIFSKKNNVGYPKKVLGKIRIPGKNDFDVYSIEPINSGEEYIEVSFTRSLDPQQDLNGLVQVEPGRDVSFSIEENKLRIWFQNKTIPEREIIIHSGIRSLYNARTLQTDQTQANRYRKRIAFHTNYPNLEFAGEGGILPESDKMVVPFFATNLRGVIVRVIRVYENNMGEFLQSNQLNEGNELAAMGDLLCRKIIFLDEKGNVDIHTRNAFAIDLKDLITPEPGGLYRIILSYNYELSAYPCAGVTRKTKRELLEENKILEQEEKDNFGNGNAYYYFSDQSWNGYRWEERNMPCSTSYYLNKQIAKNIICSNLGIIVKKGDRGKLFISVNNILTGEPEPDVSVGVFSYQNQEIARQTTWEDGTTEVELNNKKPFYLIAQKEKQKGYLRLAEGESLSMSAFDVSGEEVKNGTKGFIYTDRGVWRPGDTIYVSFILNNAYNDLPVNHPVTFELFNPSGQLYWKKSLSTRSDNFYVFKPATTQNAPTGIWNGRISVGGVTFHKKLRIETIKPNRLSIDLSFDEDIIQRDTETTATLKAQWLTGATANELKYDIYATLVPTKTTFKDWENYVFDDPGRKFQADDILFSKGTTNENGEVKIETKMMQGGFAPGMLRAQFITKVYEESGEFSVNSTQKQYSPFKTYVGILSPQEDKDPLLTNKRHIFEYVTLFPNGKTAPDRLVNINLYKVEWYWWWSSDRSQIADYVSSSYNKPVRKFSAKSNQIGKGKFQFKIPDVEWGTYYIQITDVESGHQSGILAYFDSYGENARSREGSDKAMLLTLKTDKDCYQPGDDIVVSFPSTSDSHAILAVEASGGILEHHEIKCNGTETKFSIKAIREMQPNAYISVTLLNPYHSKNNDLPIRLYGV